MARVSGRAYWRDEPNAGSAQVQRAFVDASLSGDTEVIATQGVGKKIRVLGLVVRSALAVAVRFKSAGSNNISASYSLGINDDLVFPEGEHGWFQTNANEPFVMNQSLAVSSGVKVIWMLIG